MEELIEKLKKFKSLLESINDNTDELTEDEKNEVEDNVDKDDDEDIEDTEEEIDDSGKEIDKEEKDEDGDDHDLEEISISEDEPFDVTYKLLQSIVGMHRYIKENEPKINVNKQNKEKEPESAEAQIIEPTDITKNNNYRKYHNNGTKNKEPRELNKGTMSIDQNYNTPKQIGTGQVEGILNFWDFFSSINELRIDSPKTKGINEPRLKVVDYGSKKQKTKQKQEKVT